MLYLITGILGALLVVFAFSDGSAKKRNARMARVVGRTPATSTLSTSGQSSLRRKAVDSKLPFIGEVKKLNLETLAERLQTAGMQMTPKRYLMMNLIIVIVVALLVIILKKKILLGLLIGLIVGIGFPHMIVGKKLAKRKIEFIKLFPDAIDLIVRGLRAGLPVSESMQIVSREIGQPVGPVFGTIAQQIALGVPVEKALTDVATKLGLTEFNFFVTTIILQRETGGNLGEILSNLSEILRARAMMKLKIKALSSEAKASGFIVGALPFFVLIMLAIVSPDYIKVLYTDYRGNLSALGAACSMAMGAFVMRKMTQFEI
ncbi:MAG: type II secretion system F family protein [Alphaproteobacteria bacterium]|nr:type II secretion system F family protein [Alphaproteobacteria bacterium]